MSKIIFWRPPPPGGLLPVYPATTTAAAAAVRRQILSAVLRSPCIAFPSSSLPLLVHSPRAPASLHSSVPLQPFPSRLSFSSCSRLMSLVRALNSSSASKTGGDEAETDNREEGEEKSPASPLGASDGDGALEKATGRHEADGGYPTGEFEMESFDWWKTLNVKLRLLFALPWERVKKGSVLHLVLRGQISDQLKTRFSSGLSLPEICQSFIKAAYDPRISGVYLQIEPLSCGWGKIDEIRRHILNFKKSGKFIVSYMPICGEKEYYLACACQEIYSPPSAYVALYGLTVQSSFLGGLLEKAGVEPQIQRIGRYKSAGDQLSCKSMTKEVREMLTTLLDNIYENWLETVSSAQGKTKEKIEDFLNSGVYQVEKLKEEGWITNILYDDEVRTMLKKRLGQKDKEKFRVVDYKKYSRVKNWTLGLHGGKEQIAVIRASGSISRSRGPFSSPNSSIIAEQLIDKIRTVRESKKYKAVILRIDSPGGDALASDLMWREIRLLAASVPVIASMSDVAASGGYYMAMATDVIVAEKLTLTGSIGVVTGKFSLQNLYERIGFNKEIISRGKYAELIAAEQRPFRPEEAEIFAESAQNAYRKFRDKAALSRSMTVDQMEEVAQGRVWSGKDGFSRGLVDVIGGFSQALAIAKFKANLPQEKEVKLVEISRPSPSFGEVLSGIGSYVFDLDNTVKGLLQDVTASSGVQARMDGILFEQAGNASDDNPIFVLIKDFLNSS